MFAKPFDHQNDIINQTLQHMKQKFLRRSSIYEASNQFLTSTTYTIILVTCKQIDEYQLFRRVLLATIYQQHMLFYFSFFTSHPHADAYMCGQEGCVVCVRDVVARVASTDEVWRFGCVVQIENADSLL